MEGVKEVTVFRITEEELNSNFSILDAEVVVDKARENFPELRDTYAPGHLLVVWT